MNNRAWFDMVEAGRRETELRELIFHIRFNVMCIEYAIARHGIACDLYGRRLDADWIREREAEIEKNKQEIAQLEKAREKVNAAFWSARDMLFRLGEHAERW